MKNVLRTISLLILLFFSFFYTEKAATVIKNMDEIMIKLKSIEESNCTVEPIIFDQTIIPGVGCQNIDIERSYQKMKNYNVYNESLIVYKDTYPTETLTKNLNNYIVSGNKNKNMVSFIFNTSYLDTILNVLDENEIKAAFIVDKKYTEENPQMITKLIDMGHLIMNRETSDSFYWVNSIINNVGGQKEKYCYLEDKNNDFLTMCYKYNSYTVIPNLIIEKNPYQTVKKNLTAGNIISFNTNKQTKDELQIIINHIKSKGYKIETLQKHLNE